MDARSRINDDVWTAVLAAVIVLNAAAAVVLSDEAMFAVICAELLAFVVVAGSHFVRNLRSLERYGQPNEASVKKLTDQHDPARRLR